MAAHQKLLSQQLLTAEAYSERGSGKNKSVVFKIESCNDQPVLVRGPRVAVVVPMTVTSMRFDIAPFFGLQDGSKVCDKSVIGISSSLYSLD